jgi:hypothetical protein
MTNKRRVGVSLERIKGFIEPSHRTPVNYPVAMAPCSDPVHKKKEPQFVNLRLFSDDHSR